jgi:hypothetical protein
MPRATAAVSSLQLSAISTTRVEAFCNRTSPAPEAASVRSSLCAGTSTTTRLSRAGGGGLWSARNPSPVSSRNAASIKATGASATVASTSNGPITRSSDWDRTRDRPRFDFHFARPSPVADVLSGPGRGRSDQE